LIALSQSSRTKARTYYFLI